MITDSGNMGGCGLMATIGMFDGVHRGHRYLIDFCVAKAKEMGMASAVVTFSSHPLETIWPEKAPALLQPAAERVAMLRESGADNVIVLDFDERLRRLTAREFMVFLRDCYGVKAICMGYDHRFGSDRLTGPAAYDKAAADTGLEIVRCGEAEGPARISSSYVRRALSAGEVGKANEALGREYELSGIVTGGKRIGRQIGFPTANLVPDDRLQLIPARGVYACRAKLDDGSEWPSMVNIGSRPTVETGGKNTVEAHIIGFDGDLYGCRLTLRFSARLRDERRFESLDELSGQLVCDLAETQEYYQSSRK